MSVKNGPKQLASSRELGAISHVTRMRAPAKPQDPPLGRPPTHATTAFRRPTTICGANSARADIIRYELAS